MQIGWKMKNFSCKIKINEPNRNGVMYTKDSFKQDSSELPVCIGGDYTIGKAIMNIEDEWVKIKGEVPDETFPDIFKLLEVSYSFSSVMAELDDKQTILKCVPEHIGVLNKDINTFSIVEID